MAKGIIKTFVIVTYIGLFSSYVLAESLGNLPRVVVAAKASVRGEKILLGDIAKISSSFPEHQQLVADLKRLRLAEAPPPRTRISISGLRVLALIKDTGIPEESFRYAIPKVVHIEREGRIVGKSEVLAALQEQLLSSDKLHLQVREIRWDHHQVIPLGKTQIKTQRLGMPSSGKLPLRVAVLVDEKPAARFIATAIVDDWREVPVLRRTLERGMLIRPTDVELVRLNLFKQPNDVAANTKEIVGRRVKTRMQAGETIRRALIDIPPVIPRGKKITMIFSSQGLKATATGIAIEDGQLGQTIKVRNENSKKVVFALVKSGDLVEIAQ